MALTSASTIDDALNQYNSNAGWDGDITKARLALEAVRFLLVNRPIETAAAEHRIQYAALEAERAALERFVGANRTDRASYVRAVGILK